MYKKLLSGTILTASIFGLSTWLHSEEASAITYTEAYFSKLEYKDAKHDEERLLNSKASLTLQTTNEEQGKVRSTSLVLYPKNQSIVSKDRSGNGEVGLKLTRDGKAYGFVTQLEKYKNTTYTLIEQGKGKTFYTPKGIKVRIGYSSKGNLYYKWGNHEVIVRTDGSIKRYDGKEISDKKVRTYNVTKQKKTGTTAEKLVHEAKRLAGGQYVYNGQSLFYGLDCATYTQKIYMNVLGIDIGSTTKAQRARATAVKSVKNAKVGDILYDNKGHVGIYVGNGKAYDMLIGGAKLHKLSHWKWQVAMSYSQKPVK